MSLPPLLTLDRVASGYGQSQVLWDIEFDVAPGAAVALLGRNGVGKTTLLRTIVGQRPLLGGSIRLHGEEVGPLKPYQRARAGIGFVPQGRNIFPHLTVQENLEVGLSALAERSPKPQGGIPDYVFELFPVLAEMRKRKGGVLSGGQQQQLAIGRALAGQPSLLLLDEPTEGIQPSIVLQIQKALQQIRRELHVAVVIVEQYLDFAWSFAEHYHVMQSGRVIRSGRTDEETADDVAHLVNI